MGATKNKNSVQESWGKIIEENFLPKPPLLEVPLSIVIPVYNCSERIGPTLESIARQKYKNLELILVDAGSTDKTLEIVNSFGNLISRVYTVAEANPYDMVNRGISLVTEEEGRYLMVLFPGSAYLVDHLFHTLAEKILQNEEPPWLYFGSVLHAAKRQPRLAIGRIDVSTLQKGMIDTTLPACIFRLDLFKRYGKFRSKLAVRSGYEFLVRLVKQEGIEGVFIDRVYLDFDEGPYSYFRRLHLMTDTWSVLRAHFGFKKAFSWFLGINHLFFFRWIWHRLRERLFRRHL